MLRLRIGIAEDSVDAFEHNYNKASNGISDTRPPSHVIWQYIHPRIHIEIELSQPQPDGVKKAFELQENVGQIITNIQQLLH